MFTTLHRKLFCLLPVVLLAISFSLRAGEEKPYLILISFDGFRWDYASRGITPNLDKFKQNGVSALSLEPVFPSKTFPNHLSIITGMYPENHGILLNEFVDLFSGEAYTYKNESVKDSKWYLGEAFWETAERQGIITASYFWPGSQLYLEYRIPTYLELYDHQRPYPQRVEGVLNWLRLPDEQRPHFITLYFHETDAKGHDYGPDSPELAEAVQLMDSMLGLLMSGLEKMNLLSQTNLVVVSDHGMAEVDTSRVVNIERILEGFQCRFIDKGPIMLVEPPENQAEAVFERLQEKADHYRVYLREEMPGHFHFSRHPFIPPVILLADIGWVMHTEASLKELLGRGYAKGGHHGYDNHNLTMHGIFYAMGPAFKQGYRTGTLRNIDIYPLLCKIFNIIPRRNIDGRLERISFILKEN